MSESGQRRRIGVVTSSRADYGHLRWPLREMAASASLEPRLYVTGAHLAPEFGLSVAEIERDGQAVAGRVEALLSSDTGVGAAKTIGVATLGFADLLAREAPDILLLIADRYEMLAPAAAALALRIPIAHIEGGEISEGAIDDAVRNALTRMAHLHFATTRAAGDRLLATGEEPWRVTVSGSPSLDQIRRSPLPDADAVAASVGLTLDRAPLLVAYHPVTLADDALTEARELLAALDGVDEPIVFCFPNADAGSRAIVELAREFCRTRQSARLVVNLPPLTYLGLLARSVALVGNSSSGIMEAASFEVPVVDIGERQRGRERAPNVLWSEGRRASIAGTIARAVDPDFRRALVGLENPYGDGHAAERIVECLASCPTGERLLVKRAMRLTPIEGGWRWSSEEP